MKETKQKITDYTEIKVSMKEKVVATFILLLLSTVMLGTVSFAWLTLSRSPELSEVNTAVASNGNLEIALVPEDGSEPRESQIGDGLLDVDKKNRTWGNLVNLSVPEYGLENIVLRPAVLNDTDLLTAPLKAAIYSEDGRVTGYDSKFTYTRWRPLENNDSFWSFQPTEDFGIRAISSVSYGNVTGNVTAENMKQAVLDTHDTACNIYLQIATDEYMNTLATLMGTYMTATLNKGDKDPNYANPAISGDDIRILKEMFEILMDAYDAELDAVAKTLSLMKYLTSAGTVNNAFDVDGVLNMTESDFQTLEDEANAWLSKNGKESKDFDYASIISLKNDYNKIKSDYENVIAPLPDTGTRWYDWEGLSDVVNHLIVVNDVRFESNKNSNKFHNKTVKDILSLSTTTLVGYVGDASGVERAIIEDQNPNDDKYGIVRNFELITGAHIGDAYKEKITVTVSAYVSSLSYGRSITVSAYAYTDAKGSQFRDLLDYVNSLNFNKFAPTDLTAKDTYGYVVDLWVRTNAASSYLVLQGNLLTETVKKPITQEIKTENGNIETVDVHVLTYTYEGEEFKADVYYREINGVKKWYYISDSSEVQQQLLSNVPIQKMYEEQVPIGYEGENRIWDSSSSLSVSGTGTTQGSGSCFVFYSNPEDTIKSINILSNLRVAFVDENGTCIASAYLDTQENHYYANNGKVILPLILDKTKCNYAYDSNGNYVPVITKMKKNIAQRISAIVYIDGSTFTNKEALAISDIQGHLNIQFGSTVLLYPIGNEVLENSFINASATVNGSDSVVADFNGSDNPVSVNVSVKINKEASPKTVSVSFIRYISPTQGYKEKKVQLIDKGEGVWEYNYEFYTPGSYILRWVEIDGIEYELENSCAVTINGYTVKNISWLAGMSEFSLVTSDYSWTTQVFVDFLSSEYLPSKMQGKFVEQESGDIITVNFSVNDSGSYVGTAFFSKSGTYILEYLTIGGDIYPISESMLKIANLDFGVSARVITTSPLRITLLSDKNAMPENEANLSMFVALYNSEGELMTEFKEGKLYYELANSSLLARGMETDLSWNDETKFFEGSFPTEATGSYRFSKVVVDGYEITRATERSPVFAIMPPDPPKYVGYSINDIQYAPTSTEASAQIKLQFAEAASIQPVFAYWSSQSSGFEISNNLVMGQFVEGMKSVVNDGTAVFTFVIPLNSSGTQEGWWQLVGINLFNVTDAEGNMYVDENNTYYMSLVDVESDSIRTKVISKINIKFAQKKDFSLVGSFMQSHSFGSGIDMTFMDFEGMSLSEYLNNVTLSFVYEFNTSQANGGYTSVSFEDEASRPIITFVLTADANGHYKVTSDISQAMVAGAYFTEIGFDLSFKDERNTIKMSSYNKNTGEIEMVTGYENAPTLIVKSTPPSVKITGINPSVASDSHGNYHDDIVPSYSDTTAEVRFLCSYDAGGCGSSASHDYTGAPSVTIALEGLVDANMTAKLRLSGDDATVLYEWTGKSGNNEATKTMGTVSNGAISSSIGKITANTLVITGKYEGKTVEYIVELPEDITIESLQ